MWRQAGTEDLVVALGEIAEVRLLLHGAAHFDAGDAQQRGVGRFVDVIQEGRGFLHHVQGLAVGRWRHLEAIEQLAAPLDRPLGGKPRLEAVATGRAGAELEGVVELRHQRFGRAMLAHGVADLRAHAQVGEGQGSLLVAAETLVRVGRSARIDLRIGQGNRLGARLGGLGTDHFKGVAFGVIKVDAREHLTTVGLEDRVVIGGGAVSAGVAVEVAMQLGVAGQRGFGQGLQRGENAGSCEPQADGKQGTVKRKTVHGRLG